MKLCVTTIILLLTMPTLVQAQPFPAAPKGFDTRRDGVKKGKVEAVEYESKTVGGKRKMTVYLPPMYAKDVKLPVLYLLHGAGDDEGTWTSAKKGRGADVLDNLYDEQKILPMVVVMPNSYASPAGAKKSTSLFEDELLKDVIPYVESHYAVKTDRDNRALGGLSMGGGQTLRIGLKHLDKFAWLCAFSSALGAAGGQPTIPSADEANKKLRLFWLSCGDKDTLMKSNQAFHDSLTEKKVTHIWHIDAGPHEWAVWRNDLYLVGPMLFRERK
ncbi:MAG TPA: alpha/beta hydrolase-fold protein [Gemmataceae bacterium]|nr:alpha/beta hydrolase-fold protein [Gemmataceae bacterium]